MPLTDVACRNAKPREKQYRLSDSGWLYLAVQPNGARIWRMNYRFEGKQRTLTFGRYPAMSLSEARARRDAAKADLADGHDPAKPRAASENAPTFQSVADEWFKQSKPHWTPGYAARLHSRMVEDLYPSLGHLAFEDITARVLLEVVRKIETRGAMEIAKRMLQVSGQIFRYAVATDRAETDPTPALRGALLPSPRTRHMAALKQSEIPEFLDKLQAYDGDLRTRLGLELIMHTFVRTSELLGAHWSEIDGDLWRIPPERMKMRREHLVPISTETARILGVLRENYGGDRIMPLSNNTLIYALYRMGYHSRATVHGFRGTASTILNESGLWTPDAIERQLAHVPGDSVRSAYNSARYLPERRRMMEWYSQMLGGKTSASSR